MEVKKINAQTAVVHLLEVVDAKNFPALTRSLKTLYEEGISTIYLDFAATKYLRKSCLGPFLMYHKKLMKRGGALTIINVKGENVRHLFDMLELSRIINIEGEK